MKIKFKNITFLYIFLIFFCSNVYSFYINLAPYKQKNHSFVVTRFGKKTELAFYISKNRKIIIPILSTKTNIKISFYKGKNLFKKINNFTSTYENYKTIKNNGKIQKSQNSFRAIYINQKNIKNIYGKNKQLKKVLNYYIKRKINLLLIKSFKNGYIKISYNHYAFILSPYIYLINKKRTISEDIITISDRTYKNDLIQTEFKKQVYCETKKIQGIQNVNFEGLKSIFPYIDKKIISITRFKLRLVPGLCHKDIIFYPHRPAPNAFTKKILISILKKQNFDIAKKIRITNQINKTLPDNVSANYIKNLWRVGKIIGRTIPINQIRKKHIFQIMMPEIAIINLLTKYFPVQSWIIYKINGINIIRMKIINYLPEIRLLYSKSITNKALKVMLYGYYNIAVKKFKKNFLIFSRQGRVIVIRKTGIGFIALDYNNYRNPEYHKKPLGYFKRKDIIKKFKQNLMKIN